MPWKQLILYRRHELEFYGDDKHGFATWMRDHPTKSERLLWREIRGGALDGFHFFSQVVLHGFIVDFYCPNLQLAIEVQGGIHSQLIEQDRRRRDALIRHGIHVIYISSGSILEDLDAAVECLRTDIFKFDHFTWRPRTKKDSNSLSKLFAGGIRGKSSNRERSSQDCE